MLDAAATLQGEELDELLHEENLVPAELDRWRQDVTSWPPAASPPGRRPRYPRGEGWRLREEILGAVERLLVKTGDVDAVSIRPIATAVGVTPPSIYLQVADKDAPIFAVCQAQYGCRS